MATIAVHGGVGSNKDRVQQAECNQAADLGLRVLCDTENALKAAVAAVWHMEGCGLFNAGTGSTLRLAGTIEMDAAVMDSKGALGMVAAVKNVKHPILLAEAVAQTPHRMIAGQGAEQLARALKLELHPGPSPRALSRHRAHLKRIRENGLGSVDPEWKNFDLKKYWNFAIRIEKVLADDTCDTVGAVALDAENVFAAACSTGGASLMLQGRVGDTPLLGCGFYVGTHGAVAITGRGEEIIPHLLALRVYELMAGMEPQKACLKALENFMGASPVGIIAIGKEAKIGVAYKGLMLHAVRQTLI